MTKKKTFKLEQKPIKYIENNPELGRVIDWGYIQAKLRELVTPYTENSYVPYPPMNSANWFVINSERSVGKTTNILLQGMIASWVYNGDVRIEYLRIKKEQVRPVNTAQLFATIENPVFEYVPKITGGKYNGIYYDRHFYYWANYTDGKVDKESISEKPFMHIEATDNLNTFKSNYNTSATSFVVLDEFVNANGVNREDDFLNLCHTLSTYRRMKIDMKIFLLANAINPYNRFYKELCISDDMRMLKLGEEKIVTALQGTKVWIKLVKFDEKITEKRRFNALLYFGFANPKLSGIVGGQEWAIKNYPHLPRENEVEGETRKCLLNDVYLRYYDKLLCLEIWNSTTMGRYLYVREQTRKPVKPMRIYTQETCYSNIEKFGLGMGDNLDKLILGLYKNGRAFYSYNDVGNLFETYVLELNKR